MPIKKNFKKRKKKKQQYRIRNWSQYNKALVNRGSLTLFFDQQAIDSWLNHSKTGNRGRTRTYADTCIMSMLLLKAVYHLPQRSTQGLVASLMELMGLDLPVPHHCILSRRSRGLEVELPRQSSKKAIYVVVDSTGLKVYGEGEWKVRQHGYSKRRTWRKLHLAVNEATMEIVAAVGSIRDMSDKEVLPDLLEQISEQVSQVSGDGAYDYMSCYKAIENVGARATIPPRRRARVWGNGQMDERDKNVREIRKVGRKRWKKGSNYHRRSLVETQMMRIKTIFGEKLSSREFEAQITEMMVRCGALNRMTHLGMPESYAI
jgi:hypothetical protein